MNTYDVKLSKWISLIGAFGTILYLRRYGKEYRGKNIHCKWKFTFYDESSLMVGKLQLRDKIKCGLAHERQKLVQYSLAGTEEATAW